MIRFKICKPFTYLERMDVSCARRAAKYVPVQRELKRVAVTFVHITLALGRGVASVRLLKVALLTTQTRHRLILHALDTHIHTLDTPTHKNRIPTQNQHPPAYHPS
jgi:hypothetical protein